METIPMLEVKKVLVACGQSALECDLSTVGRLTHILRGKVSVSGEPIQRISSFMLLGLRARLNGTGSAICKALRGRPPSSSKLTSMSRCILFQIWPYWEFQYYSANVAIMEAMENEPIIHIIDFQIAQGTQWNNLIASIAKRSGGPPQLRVTGIDDFQSYHARGGGLHIVAERLAKCAQEHNVPFEFYDAAISGSQVTEQHLRVQPGEAIAVNFPYVLYQMPDESVDTLNNRDRLLKLVKSLSPKVVILVEQEFNTSTNLFFNRFIETLDYYTAIFESINVALPRHDRQRIGAVQHCAERDIVNIIACEGAERVERPEPLEKWRSRFTMAGFTQCPLSFSATITARLWMKGFHRNYRIEEKDGALYLHWVNRAMATCSVWR